MSNRINLDLNKTESRNGEITWRFIFQDDNGVYSDILPVDSFIDRKELFKLVVENIHEYENETGLELLDFMNEYNKGISIDDEYFDYDELKHIIEEVENAKVQEE